MENVAQVPWWQWLALVLDAAPSMRAAREAGTEGNTTLAEILKTPLCCKLLKHHGNANAVVTRCSMDL